jgi:hypothetical protein
MGYNTSLSQSDDNESDTSPSVKHEKLIDGGWLIGRRTLLFGNENELSSGGSLDERWKIFVNGNGLVVPSFSKLKELSDDET